MDISKGEVNVWFDTDKQVPADQLWRAIHKSGFTPVRVTIGESVYEGRAP